MGLHIFTPSRINHTNGAFSHLILVKKRLIDQRVEFTAILRKKPLSRTCGYILYFLFE